MYFKNAMLKEGILLNNEIGFVCFISGRHNGLLMFYHPG
jgi:hypothetical protein